MTKFFELRSKTFSYLIHDSSEDKNAKSTTKLKFENYQNCLEATQLDNKINHLEIKFEIDSVKKNDKELIKSNKLI